jgi:hypothetical protein
MQPLNMTGHANTWEEELQEVLAERDRLRAALGEARFGIQNYLEEHGDAGGLVDILREIDDALDRAKASK